jgi:hypothetical protein
LVSIPAGAWRRSYSLQWRAIDFRSGWIDFTRLGKAETKKRRGRCRIPDRLLPHLQRASRFGCDVGPVISWAGRPVKNIRKTFETAAARVGLEDINRHVLKHTAISWAMQSGEEPWKVADFFATALPTILKHYGHHHPDQQAEVASRIGRRPRNVRVKDESLRFVLVFHTTSFPEISRNYLWNINLRRQRSDVRIISGAPTTSMVYRHPLPFLKNRFPRYPRATCSPGVPQMGVTGHLKWKESAPLQSEPAPNSIRNIV